MGIVIYPPIIDWDYMRQRPQQLMLQFARNKYLVLYFNKTIQEGPVVTNPVENLYVIHHPTFFMEHIYPFLSKVDKNKLYWSSWSKKIPFSHLFQSDVLIYDCVDDFPDWEEDERLYSDMANAIVCTADKLEDKMKSFFPNKPVYKVPNGCDWNYFSSVVHKKKKEENNSLTIGYIGAWAPWVDVDIIRNISDALPAAEILILGPDLRGDQDTFNKNVIFLGHVPYEELLEYICQMDVLILPFHLNRITESTNPIKIYEYLATGKPIVSTNLPEVRKMSSIVHVAINSDEFIKKINTAYENKEEGFLERSIYAKQHSWEERFKRIQDMITKEFPEFSMESIEAPKVMLSYETRSIAMEFCTVNSYYGDQNIGNDPIFVGNSNGYEYQCYFRGEYPSTFENVVKVYFELDHEENDAINSELVLSEPTTPWFKNSLTFNNKPNVRHLFEKKITEYFINTLTLDVTSYVKSGEVPMFHLKSTSQKLLRFNNPRLTFVIQQAERGEE